MTRSEAKMVAEELYKLIHKDVKIIISQTVKEETEEWVGGKSSVSCPLKPSDSTPLKHSTMPP